MNFDWLDLNWFLSIPGMLITGGILLIIIAIIIFITAKDGGNKGEYSSPSNVNTGSYQKADESTNKLSGSPTPLDNTYDDIDKKLEELAKNGFNQKLDNLTNGITNNNIDQEPKESSQQNIFNKFENKVAVDQVPVEKRDVKIEEKNVTESKPNGLAITEIDFKPVSIYENKKEETNLEQKSIKPVTIENKSYKNETKLVAEIKNNNKDDIGIPVIVESSEPTTPVAKDIELL